MPQKRGGPKQGMEGGYNWSALASFREQIGQGSCHQDISQTLDKHELMRGHVWFFGVISVHPEHMGMK